MRLLLVEDDRHIGRALLEGLMQEYATDWFASAEDAAAALHTADYDVVVLDISLPGKTGLQWLGELRQAGSKVPILLLTALDTPRQRVEGLDRGADDYLVKPFDFDELLARVRALLRRSDTYRLPIVTYANLTIDLEGHTIRSGEENITLSNREFSIFRELLENRGRCLSKEQLEERIYSWNEEIESNTIEVHVSSIRRKLGRDVIKTLRGIGYMMEHLT